MLVPVVIPDELRYIAELGVILERGPLLLDLGRRELLLLQVWIPGPDFTCELDFNTPTTDDSTAIKEHGEDGRVDGCLG